jgi:23S rRNA (uracil1939-C5)-methyltransferase
VIATLRIESLAAGGDGVGRRDGEVVFVPRTAPGDVVEGEIAADRKPARGRIVRVVAAGPERIEAVCPHVATCGGCDWMHLAVAAQEEGHAAIVRSAVAHATGLDDLPRIVSHPAPSPLGYRTRARLFAQARRGRVEVGYRSPGSRDLAPIKACAVLDPAIAGLVTELPGVLAGAAGEGEVTIGRGARGLPVVSLAWEGKLAAGTWATLDARVREGAWAGARVVLEGVREAAVFGDPRPRLAGADGAPLVIAPAAFAQPSDTGAVELARRVAAMCAIEGERPRHLVELFAGSGTLSVLLAALPGSFLAVEIDAQAVACARENLAARGLAGKVVAADAGAFAIPARADAVVLDPPRAGAPGAARAIAASRARLVVHVACDPPTLARDLAVLTSAGFRLTDLETFELFPQTSHVETVARLTRAHRRPDR